MICLSLLKVGKSSDKYNNVVYKNSELGQPLKITTFTNMPSNITLEDVNEEKDFANMESVVDVAYDEAGSRLWYSVDNRVRNEKWIEVTLPGIGVFRSQDADAANPAYELVREDLVAGAFRDAGGMAHFPLLDAQGSVRGYVKKSGLESAYDYYPYGTVVEISPNAGDDNKRWVPIRVTLAWLKPRSYIEGDILRRLNGWAVLPKHSFGASVQDKEFDGEHGKYYFGSRYFDPFFGMWMSPDPAGQFANPYTYGGDPVNFVDPNGEFAFIPVLIGAAIGAIVGGTTAYANCSGKDGCGWEALKMAGVGGAAGAAGGAAGAAFSGVSASAAGASGLSAAASSGAAAGSAGTSAAFAGGAVNGAISGFASSAVTYSLTADSWNLGKFMFSSTYGALVGGLMGGLTDMFRYELSTEFQWETHEKVLNYGYSKYKGNGIDDPDVLENMVNYVQNIEGTNYPMAYIGAGSGTITETRANVTKNIIKIDGNTGIEFSWKFDSAKRLQLNRTFSASRFYSTIVHEIGHLDDAAGKYGDAFARLGVLKFMKDTPETVTEGRSLTSITEISAISKEFNHRYSQYWSFNTQKYALDRYLRNVSLGVDGSDFSPWRFSY